MAVEDQKVNYEEGSLDETTRAAAKSLEEESNKGAGAESVEPPPGEPKKLKKEEEEKQEDPDKDDEEKEEADDEEEEDEEGEGGKPPQAQRQVRRVPYSRLAKEVAIRKGLEEQLAALKVAPPAGAEQPVTVDAFVKDLAAKHENVNPDVIKAILDYAVKSGNKLPADLTKQLGDLQKTQADIQGAKEEQDEKSTFNTEFSSLVKSDPTYENVNQTKLWKIASTDQKVSINGVKYPANHLPLHTLIDALQLKNPKKKSGESTRGGSRTTGASEKAKSMDDLAAIKDPKEFEKEFNRLAKESSIYS